MRRPRCFRCGEQVRGRRHAIRLDRSRFVRDKGARGRLGLVPSDAPGMIGVLRSGLGRAVDEPASIVLHVSCVTKAERDELGGRVRPARKGARA